MFFREPKSGARLFLADRIKSQLPSIAQHCPALPSIAQHCPALPSIAQLPMRLAVSQVKVCYLNQSEPCLIPSVTYRRWGAITWWPQDWQRIVGFPDETPLAIESLPRVRAYLASPVQTHAPEWACSTLRFPVVRYYLAASMSMSH